MDLRRLPSPDDLLILLTVARLGRFNAVAETLGTTHTTISRRDPGPGQAAWRPHPRAEPARLGADGARQPGRDRGRVDRGHPRCAVQPHCPQRACARRTGPDQHARRLRRGVPYPRARAAAAGAPAAQRGNAQRHPQGRPEPLRRGPRGGGRQPRGHQRAGHLPRQLLPPAVRQPRLYGSTACPQHSTTSGSTALSPTWNRRCRSRSSGTAPRSSRCRAQLQATSVFAQLEAVRRGAGIGLLPQLPGGGPARFPSGPPGRLPAPAAHLGRGPARVAAFSPRAGRAGGYPDRVPSPPVRPGRLSRPGGLEPGTNGTAPVPAVRERGLFCL